MTNVLRVLFLYFFPNELIFDPHAGVKSKISTEGLNIFLLKGREYLYIHLAYGTIKGNSFQILQKKDLCLHNCVEFQEKCLVMYLYKSRRISSCRAGLLFCCIFYTCNSNVNNWRGYMSWECQLISFQCWFQVQLLPISFLIS